jgi:hypothetical protein
MTGFPELSRSEYFVKNAGIYFQFTALGANVLLVPHGFCYVLPWFFGIFWGNRHLMEVWGEL